MPETEYLSVTEFCERYGKDPGNVRRMIQQGRIQAVKIGKQWAIPSDVTPPEDRRIKSGKYVSWREKQSGVTAKKRDTSQEVAPGTLKSIKRDAGLE